MVVCIMYERSFKGEIGLSQHQRRATHQNKACKGETQKLTNKMNRNTKLRVPFHSASAESVNFSRGAVGVAPETVVCVICERSFKGKRGLSQHQSRATCQTTMLNIRCYSELKHNVSWRNEANGRSSLFSEINQVKSTVCWLRNSQTDVTNRLRVERKDSKNSWSPTWSLLDHWLRQNLECLKALWDRSQFAWVEICGRWPAGKYKVPHR